MSDGTRRSAVPAPKLRIEGLSKSFAGGSGTVRALDGIDLDIAEYETVVLLGPSGCGKSTLLRIVAGLERPSEGSCWLDERAIDGPGRDRGLVFQRYTSFPWLSVAKNVEYGMRINGIPGPTRASQARYFLDLVRLSEFRDAYPSQLSGGMQQRVAIARTLANQPELLLMDEPFGALDAETRWQMQELLLEIKHEHKMTVLLVTHDVPEALFLADRIVFLSPRPGRILEEIAPPFHDGGSPRRKEEMFALPEYQEIEQHIMALMRETAAADVRAH